MAAFKRNKTRDSKVVVIVFIVVLIGMGARPFTRGIFEQIIVSRGVYENRLKLQLLKSDGICLKGRCTGNSDCNRANWVSKFRKINQLSYCVMFSYIRFTILSSVRYLTMSRNFLVVLYV